MNFLFWVWYFSVLKKVVGGSLLLGREESLETSVFFDPTSGRERSTPGVFCYNQVSEEVQVPHSADWSREGAAFSHSA